jgi:nitroimidazol reductase NimA-like FMN-containing flavoprotein (pyridoxamine 5'-phosphate oxidase superfamily)|tara:strand:+ start:5094 stop:5756 length:663 start_codon:yes stop_codon:yes gene_type:complete
MSINYEIKKANKVKQLREKSTYNKKTVYSILDAGLVAHVAFNQDDGPVVVPMIYGRKGDTIFLHGARKARIIRLLEKTNRASLNVTLLDGIVFARSTFNSSMQYRSVTVFGSPKIILDNEKKLSAMKIISDHTMPGRWTEVRDSHLNEVKMTGVIKLKIADASAKISSGPIEDEIEDYELRVWAGVLPITMQTGTLQDDNHLIDNIQPSDKIKKLENTRF